MLDCPRALAPDADERLNFYKLRAKVTIEDLSETLGVMAVWDGALRPPNTGSATPIRACRARHALHASAALAAEARRRPRRRLVDADAL